MDEQVIEFAGLDIGGANIKFATCSGVREEIPFPIWQNKNGLIIVLQDLANRLPSQSHIGITMTAELADCFATKPEGVRFVVEKVVTAFSNHQPPLFYRTDGRMCDAETAKSNWGLIAASNWHATACFVFSNQELLNPKGREFEHSSGFVIDVGSTTTDMIPVFERKPVNEKQSDIDRLTNGQLFYAGVGRTPICSLLDSVEFAFGTTAIARELFATTRDAFIWLGDIEENANCTSTADGRPATKLWSGQRLARLVCADRNELTEKQIDLIAVQTKAALVDKLANCLQKVIEANADLPLIFKTLGGGDWLIPTVVDAATKSNQNRQVEVVSFGEAEESGSQMIPALAVAAACRDHWRAVGTSNG